MTQDAIVRALAEPGFYPHRPERVEHVQTHISHVFLAGPYAYKLKKAVRFPFLDFATAERRAYFCAEELRLNRRLCPSVYLDVVPITRAAHGALRLGGPEPAAVDHVVWMRRLPADRMLPALLDAGAVQVEHMDALARTVAAFHASAATGAEIAAHGEPESLCRRWDEETASLAAFIGRHLMAEDLEVLADFGPWFVRTHEAMLRARAQAGRVREGHGDLHAANVCLLGATLATPADLPPLAAGAYVFDCLEFSHALRCHDVASEVAFLAMDLVARERPDLAARFVDTYVATAGDRLLPLLLPFYGCYRALVRGKVEGLKSAEPEVEPAEREAAARRARRHCLVAVQYAWMAGGPAVIACCGLSGSGKSALAAEISAATGFETLGSDALRKPGDGARPAVAAYGTGLYTPESREAVYVALATATDQALAAGRGVVADATFARAEDRARLAAVARRHRRPLVFVECSAAESVIRARLTARERTPSLSDARWETYLEQRAHREPLRDAEPHLTLDTSADLPRARASALRALWQWHRRGHATRATSETRIE
jgi:uncharacterized protein